MFKNKLISVNEVLADLQADILYLVNSDFLCVRLGIGRMKGYYQGHIYGGYGHPLFCSVLGIGCLFPHWVVVEKDKMQYVLLDFLDLQQVLRRGTS